MREELEKIIELPVAYTMRYGNPTPQYAFEQLLQRSPKLKEVLLLPLYPHYAMSSLKPQFCMLKEPMRVKISFLFKLS